MERQIEDEVTETETHRSYPAIVGARYASEEYSSSRLGRAWEKIWGTAEQEFTAEDLNYAVEDVQGTIEAWAEEYGLGDLNIRAEKSMDGMDETYDKVAIWSDAMADGEYLFRAEIRKVDAFGEAIQTKVELNSGEPTDKEDYLLLESMMEEGHDETWRADEAEHEVEFDEGLFPEQV
jgi:hypothetical protein